MSAAAAKFPPLDTEPVRTEADGDLKRRERFLRQRLAEGGYTPARLRLITNELQEVQRLITEGKQ